MKSLSKIHTSNSDKSIGAWKVVDLDVQSNVFPAEVQSEEILAFFGAGTKNASRTTNGESRPTIHRDADELSLTNWLPNDLESPFVAMPAEAWEFASPTSDFFKIPEQQIWKEKFDAEKERIELIRQARAEAEAILIEARSEAQNILLLARDEIDQAKQAGYEWGCDQLKSALAATQALVQETHQWQADFMNEAEQVLTVMLKEIAQTMFGEGVQLDANALQLNLNRIMESAQRLGDLNIFLNPRDANLLDPSWSNYQLLITGNKVRIVPSEKIVPGGCVIKGSTGMVDARVETQLAAVLNTIDETSEAGK